MCGAGLSGNRLGVYGDGLIGNRLGGDGTGLSRDRLDGARLGGAGSVSTFSTHRS